MDFKSDYHVHTWHSDGTKKPTEVVRMFSDNEYDMVAITDHDGIDGIAEAMIAGEALKIKIIPGIEFSTEYKDEDFSLELHILGYNFDTENQQLKERLKEILEDRKIRNEKLLAYLKELGYELEYEDLLERPGQTYIGKPNFERALKRKGYDTEGIYDVFSKVPKKKIATLEAMELIKNAGGMAVLAHPMQIKNMGEPGSEEFWGKLDKLMRILKKNGLKGLECFHPSADYDQSVRLVNIAGKYHLHVTNGSDYHDGNLQDIKNVLV